MTRSEAKVKVVVLLSNYARAPRGRKLTPGTADRLVDRLLADEYAARDLQTLDPNDDGSAAHFVRTHVGLFRGAGDPPRKKVSESEARLRSDLESVSERARDATIAARSGRFGPPSRPRVRRIPDVEAKRDEFALLYLAVNSADFDVPDAVIEGVFALDAVLERNRLDDRAVAELLPVAERLAALPSDAPFVRALATAIRALPQRSGFTADVWTAVGETVLPRVFAGRR
jgi:hypothetical protein